VGRTPWSAAGALVGLRMARGGSGVTRADHGIRPTI
jgi:hypothetical protein